ncbi:Anaerobic selenocysteine-containing dehydrogenase [Desulfuromusa kysingii]|uniref:Anaerobic selenocysteine-containing dehydrogenase n=1 Tax=Desulfuromusa kysingii TaxID=37625 RepID=A0A1H4DXA8_9BACT|nr:molybdopterin-dependent oxidoreductase [Desulfuromusa kysingii]SEA77414.1 Anaerobic selenocysteine-containing dehydrogenase [Desulfuromusa kysingii]
MKMLDKKVSRRSIMKGAVVVGGGAFLGDKLGWCNKVLAAVADKNTYPLGSAESIIYSVCLQCHTACPLKCKVQDGLLVKIDGNPYTPQNMLPHLPHKTSPFDAAKVDGKICPKGQSGIQSLYDPYRIVKVLKRNGPRGANKWKVVPFDQAIKEVVEGGKIFADIGEDRHVEGLKDIYAQRDAAAAAAMSKDWKSVAGGKMRVDDFKKKHAASLDSLIDPEHPDLGMKNNQFVFQAGRIEHGRKELGKRFMYNSFGSVNFFEHTTICEQSHHIAFWGASNQYKNGKWGGGKTHMKPDTLNSEFNIYFGTSPFEANFGPPIMTGKITDGIADGRLKIAVVDPMLNKTAAKAWKWVPVKPGGDAALALGMTRWIIENDRYDKKFLSSSTKAAAHASNEVSWTTANFLVKIDEEGPEAYLRASDVGLSEEDAFVVVVDGVPTVVDEKQEIYGDLEFSGEIGGHRVKTSFTLLKELAFSQSLEKWSELAGTPAREVSELAKEFTAHGKRAAIDMYRGPVQHTNGYYNGQAIIVLNMLVGNIDHKGGSHAGGSHWHELGDKLHFPFDMKKMHPEKLNAFGHKITREGSSYEKSTLFEGYPAKRPWFPFTGSVYQEIIPSAADQYPYGIKALWLHKGTPGFAAPAGHSALKILADTKKLPLIIADDIVIGESSMYADFLFPDTAIWERFGTPHTTPDSPTKASKLRQPTVTPQTEVVEVYGEKMHCSMEAVMLAIGEALNLPGCGKDAFGPGLDFTKPEDFFLKLMANLAWGDKKDDAVPDASQDEMQLFLNARKHLGKEVYSEERWKAAVGESNWKKLVYLLNRGGRFEDFSEANNIGHDGFVKHQVKRRFNMYVENVGVQRHSLTGKRFSGLGIYEPVLDAGGKVVDSGDYSLDLSTYKEILGGQSRTLPGNYWLSSILPENFIIINNKTATELGFKNGDLVRVTSPTNPEGVWPVPNHKKVPMEGRLKTIEGIRPGVVSVCWSFGHWAYGAGDVEVDGQATSGDKRRQAGLCTNAACMVDPVLKNVCMSDPIGGSASFYDTKVKLVRV